MLYYKSKISHLNHPNYIHRIQFRITKITSCLIVLRLYLQLRKYRRKQDKFPFFFSKEVLCISRHTHPCICRYMCLCIYMYINIFSMGMATDVIKTVESTSHPSCPCISLGFMIIILWLHWKKDYTLTFLYLILKFALVFVVELC